MVVVRAGKMLDVEQGAYLLDRAIRIEDGRIASDHALERGSRGGGRLIDWSAYTVLPGLIDMHTHLVGDISSADVAAPLSSSAARDALIGVEHARATLAAGFTDRARRRHLPRLRRRRAARTRSTPARSRARACSSPAPTSPSPAAAAK